MDATTAIFKVMTRVNCGVNPSELSDRHLLAEHREIKRIPNAIRSGRAVLQNIPEKFTLGRGHVKFFYDKLGYLSRRYLDIYAECRRRGFSVTNFGDSFSGIEPSLMNDYVPTGEDRRMVLERIFERNHESAMKRRREK